nr:MAG TPA: antirepressor protein [Caudoviricetes sp.]
MNLINFSNKMTSLEIVELTGKEHKNILADIRDELEKLVNKGIRAELIFQPGYYLDKNNQQRPMYTLTKEGVLQLAARYDAVVRFKLIERVTQQTPQSFSQALYLAAEQQAQIEKLQLDKQVQAQQIAELQPKATYYDLILQNNSLLSVTQIAKDYGMSAQALNSKLHELGVQFNQGGVWLLYQQHAPYGYTHSKTQNYNKSDGSQGSRVHTYWTQKGRIFLYELLKKNGIVPLIERVDQS